MLPPLASTPLLPPQPTGYAASRPYWRNLGGYGGESFISGLPWWVKGTVVGALAHLAYRGIKH